MFRHCTEHMNTHTTDLQLILGGCIQHHQVFQEGAKVGNHTLRSEVRVRHRCQRPEGSPSLCTFPSHCLRRHSKLSSPLCAFLFCPSDDTPHTLLSPSQPPPGTHPTAGARLQGLLGIWLQGGPHLHLLGVTEQGDMGAGGGAGMARNTREPASPAGAAPGSGNNYPPRRKSGRGWRRP